MRTTLDLPEDLMKEAQEALGFKSKTDVVIFSLQEIIRKKRIEELKSMAGKLHIDIDLDKFRERPRKKKK